MCPRSKFGLESNSTTILRGITKLSVGDFVLLCFSFLYTRKSCITKEDIYNNNNILKVPLI